MHFIEVTLALYKENADNLAILREIPSQFLLISATEIQCKNIRDRILDVELTINLFLWWISFVSNFEA